MDEVPVSRTAGLSGFRPCQVRGLWAGRFVKFKRQRCAALGSSPSCLADCGIGCRANLYLLRLSGKRWPLAEVTVFVPAQSGVRRTRADVCRSCCNLHCFFPSWEGISGTHSAAVCVRLVGMVMVA